MTTTNKDDVCCVCGLVCTSIGELRKHVLDTGHKQTAAPVIEEKTPSTTATWGILPGLYLHYKGTFYRVLFVGRDSTNGPNEGRILAAYISDAEHGIHFREIGQFAERVVDADGNSVPRFRWMSP